MLHSTKILILLHLFSNGDSSAASAIVFTANLSETVVVQPGVNNNSSYLLSLNYLASYVNVGVVDLYICGHFVMSIDALWSNYQTFPYSLAEIKSVVFTIHNCLFGFNATRENSTSVKSGKVDSSHHHANKFVDITVSLKHHLQYSAADTKKLVHNASAAANLTQLVLEQPRFKQMFKLTSIKICQLSGV